MSLKSGRPSHPRYLNLRGGLPAYRPPTFAEVNAWAETARERGFAVTVTADCKAIVHGVCQPSVKFGCLSGDIQLRCAENLRDLSPEPCEKHAAIAV